MELFIYFPSLLNTRPANLHHIDSCVLSCLVLKENRWDAN